MIITKRPLQDIYESPLMTLEEAFSHLNWSYDTDDYGDYIPHCDCGGEIKFSGILTADRSICTSCGKEVVDGLGLIQTGSTVRFITLNDFSLDDEKRSWLASTKEEREKATNE